MAAASPILSLDDPRLGAPAPEVTAFGTFELAAHARALEGTLREARARLGFGGVLTAPQLGVPLALMAWVTADGIRVGANPTVTWRSEATCTTWDECLSAPHLLVYVRRARDLALAYTAVDGTAQTWQPADAVEALRAQHGLDHLAGVPFTAHETDWGGTLPRGAYEAARAYHARRVDVVLPPADADQA